MAAKSCIPNKVLFVWLKVSTAVAFACCQALSLSLSLSPQCAGNFRNNGTMCQKEVEHLHFRLVGAVRCTWSCIRNGGTACKVKGAISKQKVLI